MRVVKYGEGFPATSDYKVESLLNMFCKELQLIETSSFLVLEGVRAMISNGTLDNEDVEFHFVDINEVRKCNKLGKINNFPPVCGYDLFDDYLDILIGFK